MRIRPNRRRKPLAFVSLEDRLVMAAPVLDPISAASLPAGKALMIPLTASDADGDSLTYTVTADNGDILATVKTGQPFLKMSIAGYGDMVFQLFDDIAPGTVEKITGLVNDGFYDGLTIHRIVPDFVIQGGDPNGDGSGGPGFTFDDEFSLEAIFTGIGQLAMANSGKDTNGSQFFVTQGPARFLDFNHTIYGQLLRGFEVLNTLDGVTAPVTIESMSLVTNVTDAVLQLKAPALGSTTFTVTVTDTNGEFDAKTFTATASADTVNSPPILGPVSDRTTIVGQPFDIVLSSQDFENDPMIYEAIVLGSPARATVSVNGNVVTVTPSAGFVGMFDLRVSVRQEGATNRGSTNDPRDYQTISVTVLSAFETVKFDVAAEETDAIADFVLVDFLPNELVEGSEYAASIDWGDETVTDGIITPDGSGRFLVSGSHTYARFGSFEVVVTLRDTFRNLAQNVTLAAVVADKPIAVEWVEPSVPAGVGTVSGVVGRVTDANLNGQLSDLSAKIHWGDGSSSDGVITAGAAGEFFVSGTKDYLAVGDYEIRVVVTSLGGSTDEDSGSISIANDAPVFAPVDDQFVDEGQALEFVVTAVDPDEEQTVRYQLVGPVPQHVSIDSLTGRVSVGSSAAPGDYELLVRAFDDGNPSASSFHTVNVKVRNVAPTIALDGTLPASLRTGQTLAMTGSIGDLPNSGPWNVMVDYGTGEGFVPVIYSSPRHFSINRTYATAGAFAVRVRVTDAGGAVTEIGSTVQVVEPPLATAVRTEATRDRQGRITAIRIFFDQPLDATSAKLPSNYSFRTRPGRDGIFGTADDGPIMRFRRVVFDAAAGTVTLTPAMPIALRGRNLARVRITGLKDTFGRAVDGDRNGQAGGDVQVSLSATGAEIV